MRLYFTSFIFNVQCNNDCRLHLFAVCPFETRRCDAAVLTLVRLASSLRSSSVEVRSMSVRTFFLVCGHFHEADDHALFRNSFSYFSPSLLTSVFIPVFRSIFAVVGQVPYSLSAVGDAGICLSSPSLLSHPLSFLRVSVLHPFFSSSSIFSVLHS